MSDDGLPATGEALKLLREDSSADGHWDATVALWRWAAEGATTASDTLRLPRPTADSGPARRLHVRRRRVSKQGAGDDPRADYVVIEELGRGGMGVVSSAHQNSLGRRVALKQHLDETDGDESRVQFMAEAAVIGELDHPNIVPIHDLCETADGQLFYSMKRIHGVPWNLALAEESLDRNLEIFLKVCDAVAFAHAHAVIHRDIKPHNVMLGDFGEVFLVDWGLAVTVGESGKATSLSLRSAMGGTAAYMPPEMALGDVDLISSASDIYLLGAVLFQIMTGSPPHRGETVMACLMAAADNVIADHDENGELMRIALGAMATDPSERYPSVQSLQAAVRQHASHRESLLLSRSAKQAMDAALNEADYEGFRRAIFGFEQALSLWPENDEAAGSLTAARLTYARAAIAREDLDLAASLLPETEPSFAPLRHDIARRRTRRDSRRRRIRLFARTAQSLGIVVVLVLTLAVVLVTRERNRVVAAEAVASAQRDLALETLDTLVFEVDRRLEHRPAMQALREALLNQAIEGLNRIVASLPEGDTVDERLIAAHQSIARIYHASRRNAEALKHQSKVLSILHQQQAFGIAVDPRTIAAAHEQMGDILHNYRMGDLSAARDHYLAALSLLTTGQGASDAGSLALTKLYQSLGDVNFDLQNIDEAARWYGRSSASCDAVLAREPDNTAAVIALVNSLSREGDVAYERGKTAIARQLFDRSAALGQGLVERDPANVEWQRSVALAVLSSGDAAAADGAIADARRLYEQAQHAFESLVQTDSTNGQLQRDLLVVRWTRGKLEENDGNLEIARSNYLAALDIAERLRGLNRENAEARRDLLLCSHRVGSSELELGHLEAARVYYRQAFELAVGLVEERPDNLFARTDLVASYSKLGDAAFADGDCTTAVAMWQKSLKILAELRNDGMITPDSRFFPWIQSMEEDMALCPNTPPS